MIAAVGQRGSFYGACDPSLGKLGKNADDTAIITLLRDSETGVLYVIDADIERRKPDSIIEAVIQYEREACATPSAPLAENLGKPSL